MQQHRSKFSRKNKLQNDLVYLKIIVKVFINLCKIQKRKNLEDQTLSNWERRQGMTYGNPI